MRWRWEDRVKRIHWPSGFGIALGVFLAGGLPLLALTPTSTTFLSSVGSGANNPVYGQPLTLSASVLFIVQGVPPFPNQPGLTGTITFTDGTTTLGTATVSMGMGQLTIPAPSAGPHSFVASYGGDTNYAASVSAPWSLVVSMAQTSVTVSQGSSQSFVTGQNVTFSATVSAQAPSTAIPSGMVTFTDSGRTLGTSAVDAAGNASISTVLQGGTHQIAAAYSGNANFASSTSAALTLNAGSSPATVTLSIVPTGASIGQSIVFKATVTGSSSMGSPTGTVSFMDGSVVLATATLNAGSATSGISTLTTGVHKITAVYSGDSNYGSATSNVVTVTVGNVGQAPTVTLSFSEGTAGLTLSATVSGSGTTAPTGTVQFNDVSAGTTLGTGTLANGSASTVLNPAPAGHTVQAVYSGDSNYSSASSSPLTLIVVTSGFSANYATFAPDEFASIFGASLAATPLSASGGALVTTLGGLTVTITDASGGTHAAPILYVSTSQVNFIVPSDTPSGPATLTLNGSIPAASAPVPIKVSITVANVSPSLAPVGQALPVHADGSQGALLVTANFNSTTQTWVPVPIPFGASSTDTLYLILYGTGFRHAHGSTTCSVNGQAMTVLYSGAQGGFPALDQINVTVPASLKAAGQVSLNCSVDGQTSDSMQLIFQ
jgi:uncharacterized protein (TIGR03437 family)